MGLCSEAIAKYIQNINNVITAFLLGSQVFFNDQLTFH